MGSLAHRVCIALVLILLALGDSVGDSDDLSSRLQRMISRIVQHRVDFGVAREELGQLAIEIETKQSITETHFKSSLDGCEPNRRVKAARASLNKAKLLLTKQQSFALAVSADLHENRAHIDTVEKALRTNQEVLASVKQTAPDSRTIARTSEVQQALSAISSAKSSLVSLHTRAVDRVLAGSAPKSRSTATALLELSHAVRSHRELSRGRSSGQAVLSSAVSGDGEDSPGSDVTSYSTNSSDRSSTVVDADPTQALQDRAIARRGDDKVAAAENAAAAAAAAAGSGGNMSVAEQEAALVGEGDRAAVAALDAEEAAAVNQTGKARAGAAAAAVRARDNNASSSDPLPPAHLKRDVAGVMKVVGGSPQNASPWHKLKGMKPAITNLTAMLTALGSAVQNSSGSLSDSDQQLQVSAATLRSDMESAIQQLQTTLQRLKERRASLLARLGAASGPAAYAQRRVLAASAELQSADAIHSVFATRCASLKRRQAAEQKRLGLLLDVVARVQPLLREPGSVPAASAVQAIIDDLTQASQQPKPQPQPTISAAPAAAAAASSSGSNGGSAAVAEDSGATLARSSAQQHRFSSLQQAQRSDAGGSSKDDDDGDDDTPSPTARRKRGSAASLSAVQAATSALRRVAAAAGEDGGGAAPQDGDTAAPASDPELEQSGATGAAAEVAASEWEEAQGYRPGSVVFPPSAARSRAVRSLLALHKEEVCAFAVRHGDSLRSLAELFHVPQASLRAANIDGGKGPLALLPRQAVLYPPLGSRILIPRSLLLFASLTGPRGGAGEDSYLAQCDWTLREAVPQARSLLADLREDIAEFARKHKQPQGQDAVAAAAAPLACSDRCEHGLCSAAQQCVCNPGWSGDSCAQRRCPTACPLHGWCDGAGGCVCQPGYVGPSCATRTQLVTDELPAAAAAATGGGSDSKQQGE